VDRIKDAYELEIVPAKTNGSGGGDSSRLTGPKLAHFLEKIDLFRTNLDKLVSRGYPAEAVKLALIAGVRDRTALQDAAKLEVLDARLTEAGFQGVAQEPADEHGTSAVAFQYKKDGVERRVQINWNLVTSAEYRALANNAMGIEAITALGFTLYRGEVSSSHGSLEEALDKLYDGAKKGLSFQRYKGLGEMNPQQLWETTMDPTRRRLLKVEIEDEVDADSIFSVLMGDEVEPRREFIQNNALDVKNLDV
jgi:DNA gyrase subunit B